jgi:hypothetical protein
VTPELASVLERALSPQRIRDQFWCRLCGAVTSSKETQERVETHREDCPKRAVLAVTP